MFTPKKTVLFGLAGSIILVTLLAGAVITGAWMTDSSSEPSRSGQNSEVKAAAEDKHAAAPSTTAAGEPAAELYDFAADPQFTFDERYYLILIDMDPAAGPESDLELTDDPRLGPAGADLIVRRGYSACDSAAAGDSAAENIDGMVQYGGLTYQESRLVLNAAVTTLCPQYINSGT